MSEVQLSDVQVANLTQLLTIRDSVIHDSTTACCRFALTVALADRLGTMSVQQVMVLVANLGDTTLFPPRFDLVDLLDAPAPLMGTLAVAHRPMHRRFG